jgi:hypothetical protein
MSRVHSLLVVACLFIVASCAVSPYQGKQIATSEVEFDGFTDIRSGKVRLEVYDVNAQRWAGLRTVTAAATASFAAGAICPNSPALYRYTGSIDLQWPVYWRSRGTQPPTYDAKVRGFKLTSSGELPLFFTTNPNAGNCMASKGFNSTCDFRSIATECGFTINEATVLGTGAAPWWN